jgi:hypothetical protein
MTKNDFLTPQDLFEEFGIPLQTQAKWRMKRGDSIKLPYIKLGRRVLYLRKSIEVLIYSLEINPKYSKEGV